MLNLNPFVVTRAGIEALGNPGSEYYFSRVVFGDGEWSEEEDLREATSLKSIKQSANVSHTTIQEENALLRVNLSNASLMEGYYIREVGVYLKSESGVEILYSISIVSDQGKAAYLRPRDVYPTNIVLSIYQTITQVGSVVEVKVDDTPFTQLLDMIESVKRTYFPLTGGIIDGLFTLKSQNIDYNVIPSSTKSNLISFADKNGVYGGYVGVQCNAVGATFSTLMARRGDSYATVNVGFDTNGDPYTYAPTPGKSSNNANIATTSYVKANLNDYLPMTGGVLSGNVTVNKENTTEECAVRTKNKSHNGAMLSASDGRYGLYSTTGAKWLIYCNSSGTVVVNTSDLREKDLHGIMQESEAKDVLGLDVYNFTYKSDKKKIEQSGIVAQQARDILKKYGYRQFLQIERNDGSGACQDLNIDENKVKYSVDYSRLVPYLMRGWQLHEEKIEKLEKRLEKLEKRLDLEGGE